jgi:drug/metabolite transporter (DMT)-like permease
VFFYFLGIAHLPVGIATLLNYSAPVFTAMYAAAFLGEAITVPTLGALAMTSTGVVLVILGTAPAGSLGFGRWQLVAVLSAMLSGAAGRHHPRGAQDRRLVGDLRGVLRGGRRESRWCRR